MMPTSPETPAPSTPDTSKRVEALTFRDPSRPGKLYAWRSPSTKTELAEYFKRYFGYTLSPNVHPDCIAKGHTAPLDVAWAFFSATHPSTGAHMSTAVLKGSRGLSGKSTMLAAISTLEGLAGLSGVVLGGSLDQSKRVHDVGNEIYTRDVELDDGTLVERPFTKLMDDPIARLTRFTVSGVNRLAIPASRRSARSPHPVRLRCDEVDEMDLVILDAALGQTMSDDLENKPTQTALVSTHQHPDGTMTEVLKRAAERGWPVFEYCYRECLEEVGGWLTWAMVNVKRHDVSDAMWKAEYELQEPSAEGRAINTEAVVAMWNKGMGEAQGAAKEYIEMPCCPVAVERAAFYHRTGEGDPPHPCRDHRYATGADWGRDVDWTIIATYRVVGPKKWLVAWERTGVEGQLWPEIIERLNIRGRRFPGTVCHDATGMGGKLIDDNLSIEAEGVTMVGERRTALLMNYIKAIESDEIGGAYIEYAYNEHRYVTNDDLFRSGSAFHAPDSFVAGAMALRAAGRTELVDLNPDALAGRGVLDGVR